MRTIVFLALISAPALAAGGKFTLQSKDVKANGTLADKHVLNQIGCTGENISPDLSWKNAPKDTKSFVVDVYDPDAPTGSGFWHWVGHNIPAATTESPENAGSGKGALPEGAKQGNTDLGQPRCREACGRSASD